MTSKTTRLLSYRDAINEALQQEMERNPDIILMGEDIAGAAGRADQGFVDAWGGPFRTTQGLIQQFGEERVRDEESSASESHEEWQGCQSHGMVLEVGH